MYDRKVSRLYAGRKFVRPLGKDAEDRSGGTAGGGELGMPNGPGREIDRSSDPSMYGIQVNVELKRVNQTADEVH